MVETSQSQPSTQASSPPLPPPADDERIFAIIGYFAFLFIVPLLVKPRSKFCQHHAKQSMIMFLVFIIILVILALIPLFGSIFTLAIFALYILSIYRAYRGDYWRIPVIAPIAEKIDVSMLYGKAGLNVEQLGKLREKAKEMGGKMTDAVKSMGGQEEKPQPPSSPPPSEQK